MQALTLYRPQHERDPRLEYVFAMYLLYATRPKKVAPELDGSYDIGEVGEMREKDWHRWCPYALARKRDE